MSRPEVPAAAEVLYAELAVSQPGDDTRGWPLLILLGAVGHALGPRLYDLVRDTGDVPGWTSALSPSDAPSWVLPWLAQFAGVWLTPGIVEEQQRAQITSPTAFERGSEDAMTGAAKPTLTSDDPQVRFYERNPGPYGLLVRTSTAETPDPVATLAALRSQKPAGLILTYVVSDEPLINEGTRTIDASTGTIDTATLADIT